MKAREHLAISMFFVFTAIVLVLFYDKETKILSLFTDLFHGEIIFILGIGAGLFLLGAIFPDIDSEDDGSYIFHQPTLKPLAKLVKGIFEIFGKLNHKGFLHTGSRRLCVAQKYHFLRNISACSFVCSKNNS